MLSPSPFSWVSMSGHSSLRFFVGFSSAPRFNDRSEHPLLLGSTRSQGDLACVFVLDNHLSRPSLLSARSTVSFFLLYLLMSPRNLKPTRSKLSRGERKVDFPPHPWNGDLSHGNSRTQTELILSTKMVFNGILSLLVVRDKQWARTEAKPRDSVSTRFLPPPPPFHL